MTIPYSNEISKGENCLMCNFDNNFFDDRDLVECLNRGCEVEFMYNDKKHSITHVNDGMSIT